jgi:hypothetical protein
MSNQQEPFRIVVLDDYQNVADNRTDLGAYPGQRPQSRCRETLRCAAAVGGGSSGTTWPGERWASSVSGMSAAPSLKSARHLV